VRHFDFFKFDLNLLVAFDALYAERSVTRAAQRVGMGQPGMSHALARLREQFQDELFVRAGSGIQPTVLAERLAEPVREVLQQAHAVFARRPRFDPHSDQREFLLAMPDGQQLVILPPLTQQLQAHAPHARLRTVAFDRRRVFLQLEDGEIELTVGVFDSTAPGLRVEVLYAETHACVYNPKLIRVRSPLRLEEYLAHPHVLLSHAGDTVGVVDKVLAKRNLKREIVATTPSAHVIPFLLREVKAFGIVPSRIAQSVARSAGLAICRPPVETGGFEVSMVWRSRSDGDQAHVWLRDQLRQVARRL
jgi:DNA-binding transcriptional LysR family regulator